MNFNKNSTDQKNTDLMSTPKATPAAKVARKKITKQLTSATSSIERSEDGNNLNSD